MVSLFPVSVTEVMIYKQKISTNHSGFTKRLQNVVAIDVGDKRKKGHKKCNKYPGISFIDLPGKLYSRCLVKRHK